MKNQFLILLTLSFLFAACQPEPINSYTERELMLPEFKITDYSFSQATYQPGQTINLQVAITSSSENPVNLSLSVKISFLEKIVYSELRDLEKGQKEWYLNISWLPEGKSPVGYGVDLEVLSPDGEILASVSDGIDVLNSWKEMPRYGFLVDYDPGRVGAEKTMEILNRFHINGLQFYDWMYRHETFFSDQEPYTDILGRKLSLVTVENLIEAAHQRQIAAMPYTAIYGASKAFYEQHPDWALFDRNGEPVWFGENFMVIMDPRPESEWSQHLLSEFSGILKKTAFDGIHLDQYGDPKVGYDHDGNLFPLDKALAAMINETKSLVDQKKPDGTVVFNAVTNWPIEAVAPANQDFVYIEVWPPYTSFNELGQIVMQAQNLSTGKPVVIAAYIDPANQTNALIMDAIIFANGGGRIELGENGGYLADPYFPLYKMPAAELSQWLQRYYGFAVRYQDVFGARTTSANAYTYQHAKIQNIETKPSLTHDKVMIIGREFDQGLTISLVNLLGLKHGEWAGEVQKMPTPLTNFVFTLENEERIVNQVWIASPDRETYDLQPLEFRQENGKIAFEIPELTIWTMIIVEWSESENE